MHSATLRPDPHDGDLEARVEALEYLVMGLLLASERSPDAKAAIISAGICLAGFMDDPDKPRTAAHREAVRFHFHDLIAAAWFDKYEGAQLH